jgi:prepilin-type processing-associated H-X9-DG protein
MSRTDNNSQRQKAKTSELAIVSLCSALYFIFDLWLLRNLGPDRSVASTVLNIVLQLSALLSMPAAITLGIVALIEIRRSEGKLCGRGLAIWGTILGAVFAPYTFLPRGHTRALAHQLACAVNLKGLGSAILVYSSSNDQKYPNSARWCDSLVGQASVSSTFFFCTGSGDRRHYETTKQIDPREVPSDMIFDREFTGSWGKRTYSYLIRRCHYALNPNCGPNSPGDVVLLFETTGGWNQYGGPEILTTENHGGKGCNVLFNDGSVRFVDADELTKLKWRAEKTEE